MSVPKALVVEGCSKTQTSLKSIIGTGSRDRLLCCTSGSCGSDSIFWPWSLCSPSPKNSISESYGLLILLQQPACLALIPDFVETHNYTERDLMAKPTPKKSRLCLLSVFPHKKNPTSLPTRQERLMGRDFNAYVMPRAPCVTSPPAGTPLGQMFLQAAEHCSI